MPITGGRGFLENLGNRRYLAARVQSEYRDYDVPDPFADGLYKANARTLGAVAKGKAVPTISASTSPTDWQPDDRGELLTPQRFHPAATMLWRNIIGQPISNRPAANLTHYMVTSGYGGVMPIDSQPFLEKPAAWNDPTRGRP